MWLSNCGLPLSQSMCSADSVISEMQKLRPEREVTCHMAQGPKPRLSAPPFQASTNFQQNKPNSVTFSETCPRATLCLVLSLANQYSTLIGLG